MDIWTNLGRFAFIETEHVNLRPVAYTDREAFWRIASKRTNLQFIFPVQTSQKESDFLLVHSFMKEPLGVWAIEDKVSHKMFGVIRFENIDLSKKTAEIGYFLKESSWGQGIMTECLKTLSFFAFREFGMDKLIIVTHKENIASQKVALKAHFKQSRSFKGSDRYTRRIRDYIEFQLTRGDYRYE